MKQVLIVGAGGIGSWLAESLFTYKQAKQLPNAAFTFADNDAVDFKNLGYQNFRQEDLLDNKAEIIGTRYQFTSVVKRIEDPEYLKTFDCVVSAVDNSIFRKLLFTTLYDTDKYYIDLRSEGRTVAYFTRHPSHTLQSLLNTLPKTDVLEGSCQLDYELKAGIIQGGNKIIAQIGAQLILNWYRGERNPPQFFQRF